MKNITIVKIVVHLIVGFVLWGFALNQLFSSKTDIGPILGAILIIAYVLFYVFKLNKFFKK